MVSDRPSFDRLRPSHSVSRSIVSRKVSRPSETRSVGFWSDCIGRGRDRLSSMAEAMEKQLILQILNTVLLPCLSSTGPKKRTCTAWVFRRRRLISRSVLCGAVLFSLGLVSLFTGQIAADLEWSSRIRGRWRSKRVCFDKERKSSFFLCEELKGFKMLVCVAGFREV